MLVAGVDVGAATAKSAIVSESGLCAYAIRPTGFDVIRVSHEVIEMALESVGYHLEDLERIVSTGYARNSIPFANRTVTEILCHAKGAIF